MAYATVTQLLARYDARVLGQYAGDGGIVVQPNELEVSERVIAALDDASAMIDASLQRSRKYSAADLAAAGVLPVRICCDLAVGLILESRLLPQEEVGNLVPRYKEARDWLDRLANGTEVLPLDPQLDAGLPKGNIRPQFPASYFNRLFAYWGPLGTPLNPFPF